MQQSEGNVLAFTSEHTISVQHRKGVMHSMYTNIHRIVLWRKKKPQQCSALQLYWLYSSSFSTLWCKLSWLLTNFKCVCLLNQIIYSYIKLGSRKQPR